MEVESVEQRLCNRCDSEVVTSELEEYSYQCLTCDEDLYKFETYTLPKQKSVVASDVYVP